LITQCEKASINIKPALIGTSYTRPRTVQELDELQAKLVEVEQRLLQMNTSQDTLNKRYLELTEMRHVLRETAYFFEEVNFLCIVLYLIYNVKK
jgi:V-type H+-transporting ATPase subunit a